MAAVEEARQEVEHLLATCDYNAEVDFRLQRVLRMLRGEEVEPLAHEERSVAEPVVEGDDVEFDAHSTYVDS